MQIQSIELHAIYRKPTWNIQRDDKQYKTNRHGWRPEGYWRKIWPGLETVRARVRSIHEEIRKTGYPCLIEEKVLQTLSKHFQWHIDAAAASKRISPQVRTAYRWLHFDGIRGNHVRWHLIPVPRHHPRDVLLPVQGRGGEQADAVQTVRNQDPAGQAQRQHQDVITFQRCATL